MTDFIKIYCVITKETIKVSMVSNLSRIYSFVKGYLEKFLTLVLEDGQRLVTLFF